jgi:hypothetical protein
MKAKLNLYFSLLQQQLATDHTYTYKCNVIKNVKEILSFHITSNTTDYKLADLKL